MAELLKNGEAMNRAEKNRKSLGQFMTPERVAGMVAKQVPLDTDCVIDLSAGDCALLKAVHNLRPDCALVGCELDPIMHARTAHEFTTAKLLRGNGMTVKLDTILTRHRKVCIVGNPPFTEATPTALMQKTLIQAFPGLKTRLGVKRLELYFLARALLVAKRHGGLVSIVMPISFADGDLYVQYRRELMTHYRLIRAIEIPENAFASTEARTVLLVIDTAKTKTLRVKVSSLDAKTARVRHIYHGQLNPGDRLDARYWAGQAKVSECRMPRLMDVGVTITRGRHSRKAAAALAIGAIHTTDLRHVSGGEMSIATGTRKRRYKSIDSEIAKPGDILLPRTGSRVTWRPVLVHSGTAPITDHVFRIRAPEVAKDAVWRAFQHPAFDEWLQSMSKGVCATVLTKRELLTMPLFR